MVAAVLILEQHFVLGGVAFILGSLMDMLDGRYSRMSGKGTPFGAFLDSTLDRIEEGVVLAAVAAYFAKRATTSPWAPRCSPWSAPNGELHARAGRGAGRGVQGRDRLPRGPGSDPLGRPGVRGRRADLADFDLLEPAIYVMAALTVFTALQRVLHVRRAELAGGRTGTRCSTADDLGGCVLPQED